MKTATGAEKPLAEWTLKDVKDWYTEKCEHQVCETCPFGSICSYPIGVWEIEKKPKFTAQEIQDAKTLDRIFQKGLQSIGRSGGGEVVTVSFDCTPLGCSYLVLSKDSFKSIENGKCYKLYEIIGDSNA